MLSAGLAPSFIGIMASPGFSVLDTAAQDGCVGSSQLPQLADTLSQFGLQFIWTERRSEGSNVNCTGIGGGANWLGAIETPVGLAGLNGVLRLNVVEDDEQSTIPLLLPINLQEHLGFETSLPKGTYTISKHLPDGEPRTGSMFRLPGGHREVSIIDFDPELGWNAFGESSEFEQQFRFRQQSENEDEASPSNKQKQLNSGSNAPEILAVLSESRSHFGSSAKSSLILQHQQVLKLAHQDICMRGWSEGSSLSSPHHLSTKSHRQTLQMAPRGKAKAVGGRLRPETHTSSDEEWVLPKNPEMVAKRVMRNFERLLRRVMFVMWTWISQKVEQQWQRQALRNDCPPETAHATRTNRASGSTSQWNAGR